MEEDKGLERIRQKKLKELMEKASERGERAFRKEGEPTSNKPVEVTDTTFAETIRKHPLVVIDCWAPWCAPCHMVAPIVEEMARDYAGKILFGKLNVDENQRIAMQTLGKGRPCGFPTPKRGKTDKAWSQIRGLVKRKLL